MPLRGFSDTPCRISPTGADAPGAARLLRRVGSRGAGVGEEIPRHSRPGESARLHAAALARGRTTSARLTIRTTPSGSLAKFKEWGLDAKIEIFDVLFPTPKERLLEMMEPTRFTAKIAEPR